VVAAVKHAGLVGAVVSDTLGIVGTSELSPTVLTMGNTPAVGTAGAELTPRLLISVEPNGIPVRANPPDVVGNVDVGAVDEAMLFEPDPHIPDAPDVSGTPGVGDIPDVADIPDSVDGIPVDIGPDVDVEGVDVEVPKIAAVAGASVPAAVPPPS
jgi:hypothetical protein